MKSDVRLIAFYLPQFHPIPENDEWWGKGFTEWTTVAKAKPLFRGHYQPRIPADLGFYDLRLPETREAQAQLARDHGIEGFCYWHYWLGNGKRLLERPFEEVLSSGEPNFPFCLGWANVPWTGEWAGYPERVMVAQTYDGLAGHKAHFYHILTALSDDRYVKVNGKPLIYVHRPKNIPDVKRFTDYWRELALKVGLKGLHLVGSNLGPEETEMFGFDAFSYHYPNWGQLTRASRPIRLCRKKLNRPKVLSYGKAIDNFVENNTKDRNFYPLLIPNWDNSPRVGWRGFVLHNSTPQLFRVHVKKVLKQVEQKPIEQRIVFIKSWNEWAEGNYLEPDLRYGRSYLQVIKDAVFGKVD